MKVYMLSRIDHNKLSWIDIHKPSSHEIAKIAEEFSLSNEISEELMRPSFHPKAENTLDTIFLVFHLPLYDTRLLERHSREIDIIISKKFLLTIHYDPIEPLADLFSKAELDLNFRKILFGNSADKILYELWQKTYDQLMAELDHIQKKVDRIEDRIFSDERKEFIEEVSILRRDVLDFHRSIRPHGLLIEEFAPLSRAVFGPEFSSNIKSLSQKYRRLLSLADNNKDALEVLYDTYNALQNRRSTEVMKVFTMLALMTFPLTLIAAIFSIETKSRPIVGSPNDFWIILAIMVGVVIGMLFYFKSKKWIN